MTFSRSPLDDDRLRNERLLVAVEIARERLDAAFVAHLLDLGLGPALIGERHLDAGIEKGELAQPVLEGGEIEFRLREDFVAREKGDAGAAPVGGLAHGLQRMLGLAVLEAHEKFAPVAPDREIEPARAR